MRINQRYHQSIECVGALAGTNWYDASGAADHLELGKKKFFRIEVDSSKVHRPRTDPRDDCSKWY
jgi:hypothetical protein